MDKAIDDFYREAHKILIGLQRSMRRYDAAYARRKQRWEEIVQDPSWEVFTKSDGSQIAYKVGSKAHAQAVREREQQATEAAREQFVINNPVEAAFEELVGMDQVTRIQCRAELDKLCAFTPERLAGLVTMLQDDGIEVK